MYFEVRDVEMLLDGGINSVVHVQISAARMIGAVSLSHPATTRRHEQPRE